MGIHDFTKCFKASRVVKLRDFAGTTVAVDALGEIWRAALGAKSVTILTDAEGRPTLHITVILAMVSEFSRQNIAQIWVFDHSDKEHNPAKLQEYAARGAAREQASRKIKQLADFAADNVPTFDIPEEPIKSTANLKATDLKSTDLKATDLKATDLKTSIPPSIDKLNTLHKRAFHVTAEMIEDVIIILNALGIPWMEAPAGFEAEAICSQLNAANVTSWVYSGDTDPIAFNAAVLVRRNVKDKLYYEYTRADICEQIKAVTGQAATISDIRKISVILGCDFCARTPGIGPATVKKKYQSVTLTEGQTSALLHYEQTAPNVIDQAKELIAKKPIIAIDLLIKWLVEQKNFNHTRLLKTLSHWIPEDDKDPKAAKVTKTAKVTKDTKTTKAAKVIKPIQSSGINLDVTSEVDKKNHSATPTVKPRTLPAKLLELLAENDE